MELTTLKDWFPVATIHPAVIRKESKREREEGLRYSMDPRGKTERTMEKAPEISPYRPQN